jgi:WD40 repeat protein
LDLKGIYGGLALDTAGERVAFDDYAGPPGQEANPRALTVRIKVHEVETGREQASLAGPATLVTSLSFSPDGQYLAAGDFNHQIRIWQKTYEPLHTQPLEGPCLQLAISPDGRRLAGVDREQVKVWDVLSGHEVLVLRGAGPREADWPFNPQVAWSPDGKRLACTNHDNTLSIWDGSDPEPPDANAASPRMVH